MVDRPMIQQQQGHSPVVTIIVPTYARDHLLVVCLDSIVVQTYQSIEVVVVCNGCGENTLEIIKAYHGKFPSLKVVRLLENVWSWDSLEVFLRGVHRVGLEAATGEYVLFLSDDDALTPDFIDLVVKKFAKEPRCVAVMGTPINRSYDTGEEWITFDTELYRKRPEYEDGKTLALRYLSDKRSARKDFHDPGFGYVVKTSLYRDQRGDQLLWKGYEREQYLLILPHGLVGFEPNAYFYWYRHSAQANVQMSRRIGMLSLYAKKYRLERKLAVEYWRVSFGEEWSGKLVNTLKRGNFPRTLRYLWQSLPHDSCASFVIIQCVRTPLTAIPKFLRTDAREGIFWIIFPRAFGRVTLESLRYVVRKLKCSN